MEDNKLLVVENLKKYFSSGGEFLGKPAVYIKAVDGVDFAIKKGETLGLVGESGCGKTTLGRTIIMIEEATDGKVFFDGKDFFDTDRKTLRIFRKDMQMIFQDPYSSLNPRMTVDKIIGEGFAIYRVLTKKERQDKIKNLMEIVGLQPEHIKRYPHEFSGGQRQRICVARALALNPKFVIADEPVSALDVSIRAQILNLFVRLQSEFNLTYLFISHDLSVVRHIGDNIIVMYMGKFVEQASSHTLFSHPFHPYTQALISAIPKADPFKKKEKIILKGDISSVINPPSGCRFHPRCRYQQEICRRKAPIMKEIEKGHWVACHFPIGC